jgi:hypothetical protein
MTKETYEAEVAALEVLCKDFTVAVDELFRNMKKDCEELETINKE